MRFEWDAVKEAMNRRKHGVSFDEAEEAIRSPIAITVARKADKREVHDYEEEIRQRFSAW